jgi:hypothetical protein
MPWSDATTGDPLATRDRLLVGLARVHEHVVAGDVHVIRPGLVVVKCRRWILR